MCGFVSLRIRKSAFGVSRLRFGALGRSPDLSRRAWFRRVFATPLCSDLRSPNAGFGICSFQTCTGITFGEGSWPKAVLVGAGLGHPK